MPDLPADRFPPSLTTGQAAFRSWKSMKTWVMVWLWYLNVIYWVAFAHLDRAEAFWAAIAYLAAGPVIAVMLAKQRGLFWSTAACLAMDVVDVARWLGGERYVLGSPAAHRAGASKLTAENHDHATHANAIR